ncbi:hypothetical protein ACQ4PT_069949 [Festuca glaucescens]
MHTTLGLDGSGEEDGRLSSMEGAAAGPQKPAGTAVCLVVVGLGGAALLVWWALAFHSAHARLWMVPAGLVLLGTPILAWLSLLASDPCRCGRRPVDTAPTPSAHTGA